MALTQEFSDFIRNWNEKADQIRLGSLATYFDKFFTLYVVYNRLYAEITFDLNRAGRIDISRRNTFPDNRAATDYVLHFIGAGYFVSKITLDDDSLKALEEIIALIQNKCFHIMLDMVTGEAQPQRDITLLEHLTSENACIKAKAILRMIYSVRCNMFHGHKGFDEVQIEILEPTIILLQKTITIVLHKLQRNTSC